MKVYLKELTIEKITECRNAGSYMVVLNPGGELFQGNPSQFFGENEECEPGIMIDLQSLNLIVKVHEALKPQSRVKFDEMILQREYNFASLLDKMWGWVK